MNVYLTGTRWSSFEQFLEKRGIKLTPWQETFARALLSLPCGAGKTFLLKQLTDFDQSRTE